MCAPPDISPTDGWHFQNGRGCCARRSTLQRRLHNDWSGRFPLIARAALALRVTNAFSKKIENHACAIALHTMFYNFVRIHQTLKVKPAMAAGVTKRLWEMTDFVEMVEAWEVGNTPNNSQNAAQIGNGSR